jgi:hypothetical protein
MATFDIKVIVEYNYEVEADNVTEAEELGWHYEDYAFSGEVYSIDVTQTSDDEDEDGETED